MTKSVAVLGCGPSGLMAAHAASLLGWNFRVYSKKRKSRLFGSQYLHKPIPGMTDSPAATVTYHLEGTPESYRRKVYGPSWDGTVSPEDLEHDHYAWDIRQTYDKMWATYCSEVVDVEFGDRVGGFWYNQAVLEAYDLVISTVPRKLWAAPGDEFFSSRVWAYGDAPDLGQQTPFRPRDFTVICDGTKDVGWYRASNIFGFCTIEWPEDTKPPLEGIALVEKPLTHNSTAASEFIHLGRYGAWQKGVLTTDVFDQAMKVLAEDKM